MRTFIFVLAFTMVACSQEEQPTPRTATTAQALVSQRELHMSWTPPAGEQPRRCP